MPLKIIRQFLALQSASGLLLMAAAMIALVLVNSPLSSWYEQGLMLEFEIRLGQWQLEKPLLLWINDGLMAVFFFLIGLELKREVLVGELRSPTMMILPGFAAIGGMLAPAAIYTVINRHDPVSMAGWAIPTATDIAFALGVLALLGSRIPNSLKLFVMTLAVVDDLLAIVIIAIFYSANLSLIALILGAICIVVLALLNRRGVRHIGPYVLIGLVFWVCVLKSGVHATLAGVITAFFVPLRGANEGDESSPLETLEHHLHPYVAFLILPIFGFANAGVSLSGLTINDLVAPVPLGIAAGLVVGKTLGILAAVLIASLTRLAPLPKGCDHQHMLGVSLLCGIGFTMSLFIASLAFEAGGNHALGTDRLGILIGSLLAAVFGYLVLRFKK